MLPWKIELRGTTHLTFNANISRALVALLQKNAVIGSRISGEGLLVIVRTGVDRSLEPDLNLLDADYRATAALATLRQDYSVLEAEINAFHHPEYGTEWSGNQPHETNLHAVLKSGFPPNISEALVLEYKDSKVQGVETFLESASKYENSLMSVTWLADYIREHEQVPLRISYVHNASFGDKALQIFIKDMRALGRNDLVKRQRSGSLK